MSVTMIHKAIQFAAEKHKGQIRRGSKLPYVIHPLTVMYYISKFKGDSKHIDELLCAGILHDTIEDTDCTYIEIERRFGPMVASIVMELTSDEDVIKKIGKNAYLKAKMILMSKYAFLLKLLDRLANCLDNPKEQYLVDTIDLMRYLSLNRPDLSERQISIINLIIECCETELEKFNHNEEQ